VVTFSDLSIDKPGTGYTLTARASAFDDVFVAGCTSSPFDVIGEPGAP
jgi:hypothetical protein